MNSLRTWLSKLLSRLWKKPSVEERAEKLFVEGKLKQIATTDDDEQLRRTFEIPQPKPMIAPSRPRTQRARPIASYKGPGMTKMANRSRKSRHYEKQQGFDFKKNPEES